MSNFRLLLQLICLLLPCVSFARDAHFDSLLVEIDKAIDHSQQYVDVRQGRITELKRGLQQASTDASRYDLCYRLFEEYKPFINDSAIHYLNQCTMIAQRMGRQDLADRSQVMLAISCSNTGMYDEALAVLDRIDPLRLQGTDLGHYHFAKVHVYGELAYYTHLADMKKIYGAEADKYRSLLRHSLPADDDNRMQAIELELFNQGRYKESKAINDAWLKRVKKGSHVYALVALYRYLEYKSVGDTVQMMRWLGESVITDLQNGVMDQGSMWEMANELMLHGDVDRAHKYIGFMSDCATKFGSRQRLSQISPLLSSIAMKYKQETEIGSRRLKMTLVIISVMALLMLASLFYVNRQRQRLAEARDNLSKSNDKLSELNARLVSLNAKLKESNSQLLDANRVKEEYVGRFMRLCSTYVDRLDDFRRKTGRLVKTRKYDEVIELTQSSQFKDRELDELYANFDSAFLHLFPNFVESFNAMLRPEEQVVLPDKLRLNTTVRIFALIRLGIDDSSKIAEFLHYSVNTIYNYRARVKNGALTDRDTFEERIKLIGASGESLGAEPKTAEDDK